jgi:hypothetical protein
MKIIDYAVVINKGKRNVKRNQKESCGVVSHSGVVCACGVVVAHLAGCLTMSCWWRKKAKQERGGLGDKIFWSSSNRQFLCEQEVKEREWCCLLASRTAPPTLATLHATRYAARRPAPHSFKASESCERQRLVRPCCVSLLSHSCTASQPGHSSP